MTTVQIMRDFYDRALASGNAPQSLLDVQREWLVKLRKENGLVYAVNRAGPFIMSSQGNAELTSTSTKLERKEAPFSFRKLPKPGSFPYIDERKACVDRQMPPNSPVTSHRTNVLLSVLSKGMKSVCASRLVHSMAPWFPADQQRPDANYSP